MKPDGSSNRHLIAPLQSNPTPPVQTGGETSRCRCRMLPWIIDWHPMGVDVGFGGDPLWDRAITFDLERPYTQVGRAKQHLSGDCRALPFLDGSLDYIYSSHLLEDFFYEQQVQILLHWARKIRCGGRILLFGPNQQKFLQHCKETGQGTNDAHKEADYSYQSFVQRVLLPVNLQLQAADRCVLRRLHGVELIDIYSWEMILEKQVF